MDNLDNYLIYRDFPFFDEYFFSLTQELSEIKAMHKESLEIEGLPDEQRQQK